MRCLTLAKTLSQAGWRCGFACSPDTAAVVPALGRSGHEHLIIEAKPLDEPSALARHWVGGADLLIVDHYGRDATFEGACRPWARRIMVIDDLADRSHDCDILLDQTMGREEGDYAGLVPDECRLLLGPAYALLRPAFAQSRPATLERRKGMHAIRTILVSMGAADPHNVAAVALEGIRQSGLDVEVDVVAGAASPHLGGLRALAATFARRVTIYETVEDMAGLMACADLAIGAAGSSSWERCCLGLPSFLVITATNQEKIAAELERRGAIVSLGRRNDVTADGFASTLTAMAADDSARARMGEAAAGICDGQGSRRVVEELAA